VIQPLLAARPSKSQPPGCISRTLSASVVAAVAVTYLHAPEENFAHDASKLQQCHHERAERYSAQVHHEAAIHRVAARRSQLLRAHAARLVIRRNCIGDHEHTKRLNDLHVPQQAEHVIDAKQALRPVEAHAVCKFTWPRIIARFDHSPVAYR